MPAQGGDDGAIPHGRYSNLRAHRRGLRVHHTPEAQRRSSTRIISLQIVLHASWVTGATLGGLLGTVLPLAVDITATDRRTVEKFEAAAVASDEVIAVRRLFGQPDYFVHVAVADAEAFETFQTNKLIGLPAVARAVSHQTMKRLKG